MGIGALNYQGVKGGLKLNDVIEEFKYVYKDKKIKAGDFVNFVNGIAGEINYGTSNGIQLNSESISGDVTSVVELDENRVFVAHSHSSSYYLYGVVLTIDGTTITKGTDTQLSTSAQSGYAISAKLLPNGNVFIAYPYGSSRPLNALIATISGTTVSYASWITIQNMKNAGDVISTEVLANGNVFIAFHYDGYVGGNVCSVNGTTITKGSTIAIASSNKYVGKKITTQLLEDGSIFIAHSSTSSYYLYAFICTIDGTTMTAGTDLQLSTTGYTAQHMSLALLEKGNVFVAHSYTNSFHLYGMICVVSGTTITPGTDIQLNAEESVYASEGCKAFSLTDNRVLIISGRNTRVGGMICSISGTTIIVLSDVKLNEQTYATYGLDALVLSNGIIFVHYSDLNYRSYAQTFSIKNNIPTNEIVGASYETQVTLATEPPFDGIALSSGVGGDDTEHNQQVKIARPTPKAVVKQGDIIPKTWTEVTKGTEYVADDGTRLTAISYSTSDTNAEAFRACDGSTSTRWTSLGHSSGVETYLKLTFPSAKKITKMKVMVTGTNATKLSYIRIYGSNSNSRNVLYETTSIIGSLTEISLSNTDYYNSYEICPCFSEANCGGRVWEWQTSEYEVYE